MGGAVISELVKEPTVEVVAAARNVDKARELGVPIVHLDLDKIDTFAPALEDVDRVFMATGYTVDMLRQSKDLVNAATRAKVKQIVHLGACGDDDTRVAHYGWHQFIERYIEWREFGSLTCALKSSCRICSDTVEKVSSRTASSSTTSVVHGLAGLIVTTSLLSLQRVCLTPTGTLIAQEIANAFTIDRSA